MLCGTGALADDGGLTRQRDSQDRSPEPSPRGQGCECDGVEKDSAVVPAAASDVLHAQQCHGALSNLKQSRAGAGLVVAWPLCPPI